MTKRRPGSHRLAFPVCFTFVSAMMVALCLVPLFG
jgi:hypothetical protein